MELTEKTPVRLTQVSLFFSIANFILNGVNSSSLLLFLVFTLAVYSTTRIFIALNQLQHSSHADMSDLMLHITIAGVLFVGIATFAYSYLFGVFYAFVTIVYLISPYDRAWLAGRSRIVIYDNKVEYREV